MSRTTWGWMTAALLAVFIETRCGHDVHAMILSRHELVSGWSHPIYQSERTAVSAGPVRSVRAFFDERHALLELSSSVRREQVGRQHGQVNVGIG